MKALRSIASRTPRKVRQSPVSPKSDFVARRDSGVTIDSGDHKTAPRSGPSDANLANLTGIIVRNASSRRLRHNARHRSMEMRQARLLHAVGEAKQFLPAAVRDGHASSDARLYALRRASGWSGCHTLS